MKTPHFPGYEHLAEAAGAQQRLSPNTAAFEAWVAVQLPADRGASKLIPADHARYIGEVPKIQVEALTQYATDDSGIAWPLLAAFALLLARLSGQPDLQLQVAQRSALAVALTSARSFRELIAMIGSLPFHQSADARNEDTPALHFRYQSECVQPQQHDDIPAGGIALCCTHTDAALELRWHYDAQRLRDTSVARLHRQFLLLLGGLLEQPSLPVDALPLFTSAELHTMLVEWNATTLPYADTSCIQHLFEAQARQQPNAPALTFGAEGMSYGELDARANQLAHYLRRLGIGPEVLVALGVERSMLQIIGLLAVLKAGGAYLPLDTSYPDERLAFMLADAAAPVLLTTSTANLARLLPPAEASGEQGRRPAVVLLDVDWPRIAREPVTAPVCEAGPDNLAYVIYTSGSTGRPKGTLLAHRGLCSLALAQARTFALGPGQRVLQFASSSFDASVWEWVMALCSGATLCLARQEQLASPTELHQLLTEQAITIATLPPSLLALLPAAPLPDLHTLITAGEACNAELVARWAPGRSLYNAYGPTETTICATWYRCEPTDAQSPPIGRPLPNMQLFVLDAQRRSCPVGVPGELYIGGFALARGYLNRPELTEERFIWWQSPVPLQAPGPIRLYKTGDLVRYRDDGNVEFLGRLDHQVKLRGFRIELAEIEAALRLHPAVADTVVLVHEAHSGVQQLVAYCVIAENTALVDPGSLRAFLAERLPAFMLPAAYIPLAAFPTTPNGKIDRKALPVPHATADQSSGSRAMTPDEMVLADIWAEVLGQPRVGIDDDFFDLGGHSLLAARAISLIGQLFGRKLALRALYEAPTVAAFAAAMQQANKLNQSVSPLDLAAEIVLDGAINPAQLGIAHNSRPNKAILLTGATGFLGAGLLNELLRQTSATIYCLVRAATNEEAYQRLKRTQYDYQIDLDDWLGRVVPIRGDLRQARFDLSPSVYEALAETIDLIVHAGAQVHYLYPYSALKASNVHGTIEVLRLACTGRLKQVHHISTIAVGAASGAHHVGENDDLGGCLSERGYDQSKWVAEGIVRIAQTRDVPVTIYRTGRIGAHSVTGVSNPSDFFVRLLAACVTLGRAPDVPLVENLIPVDFAARLIVQLCDEPTARSRVFHLMNPHSTNWQAIIESLRRAGYALDLVPYTQWRESLSAAASQNPILHGVLALAPDRAAAADWIGYLERHRFDMRNMREALAHAGLNCPLIDDTYLKRLIADCAQRGMVALLEQAVVVAE